MRKRENWLTFAVIVLSLLLLACLVYMAVKNRWESSSDREMALLKQGAEFGFQQAVAQLMKQAENCQPVYVFTNNQTDQLISAKCLGLNKSITP